MKWYTQRAIFSGVSLRGLSLCPFLWEANLRAFERITSQTKSEDSKILPQNNSFLFQFKQNQDRKYALTHIKHSGPQKPMTRSNHPLADEPDSIVLIVDDEPQIGRFIGMCIERLGMHTMVCNTVAEAREILAQRPVSLVLTDLLMPGEGGEDLIQWMQEHHPDTPVVVITAFSGPKTDIQNDYPQVRAILAKPFTVRQLDQTIIQVLWPR